MKKTNIAKLVAALAIVAVMMIIPSAATTANMPTVDDIYPISASYGTITVTGTGAVKVTPDMASITFGVETRNAVAATAQSENSTQMTALIDAITKAGIDKKDIATSNYSVYTDYRYTDNGERTLSGYVVNNSVTVTVRDLKKLGSLIDAASKAGSNSIGGISFGVSNYEAYYNEALKEAVANAGVKAGAIASATKVKIGSPTSITENAGGYYAAPMNERAIADATAGTPVEVGTTTISASVTVSYQY